MACWGNFDNTAAGRTLVHIGSTAGGSVGWAMYTSAGKLRVHKEGTGQQFVDSTTSITTGAWHHCAGVFASTTSRSVHLDGVNENSGTTSVGDLASVNSTAVGILRRSTLSLPMDGKVAWPAIWNAALTDEEIASLARGAHPITVRPHSLIWFPDLRTGRNLVGPLHHLAETGTVAVAGGFPYARTPAKLVGRLFILPTGINESSDESISVTEATLTFTPSEVTLSGAAETVNVTEDTLTLTPSTAFVDESLNVTEGTLTFTASTAFVDEVINTTEASLNFSASTAFVDETINVTESSLSFTASAATISEGATINVTEDTLTFTASAVTLTETIPVTEDTLTFTASTATIADGNIIEVTEDTLTFTASTAFVDEVINVTEQSLTFTASAATVRDTIQVSEDTLTFTASSVTIDETIPVTEDSLTFTVSAVTISDGTGVDPPNIDGQASVTISSNYGQVKIYCRGGGEYFTWTETVVIP